MLDRGRGLRRVSCTLAAVALTLLAGACSDGGGGSTTSTLGPGATTTLHGASTTTTLALTEQQAAELQARALKRTWVGPSLCIDEEAASGELPAALARLYEEVLYVELHNFEPSVGWDRCTLVGPGPVKWYRHDVVGVDVWILSGFLVGRSETHLFRWNGTAWIDASPEETGITVTTLIS